MLNVNITDIARLIAQAAHEAVGQKRKNSGEVYWMHPYRVACTVEAALDDHIWQEKMTAAAWLHDVLEDTAVSKTFLMVTFGNTVLEWVEQLTDPVTKKSHHDLNRWQRFILNLDHKRANMSPEAAFIKLADVRDNVDDIKEFSTKYLADILPERVELVKFLEERLSEDDDLRQRAAPLLEIVTQILEDATIELKQRQAF